MDYKAFQRAFGDYTTPDFTDLVEDIFDRIECDDRDDLSECVIQAIDEGLIYYDDEWTLLKHYCTPQDADWNTALEQFIDEMISYASSVYEFEEEEDDELEEGCNGKKTSKDELKESAFDGVEFKDGMKEKEIRYALRELAKSQGFYGRVLRRLDELQEEEPEAYASAIKKLEEQQFKDILDLVMFFET